MDSWQPGRRRFGNLVQAWRELLAPVAAHRGMKGRWGALQPGQVEQILVGASVCEAGRPKSAMVRRGKGVRNIQVHGSRPQGSFVARSCNTLRQKKHKNKKRRKKTGGPART